MALKYETLEELRRKKQLLKSDIKDLEGLITFQNPQESLSVMTGGVTDHFLKTKTTADGDTKLSLNTGNIIREVSGKIKENVSQHSILNLATSEDGFAALENIAKASIIAGVGSFAKRNMHQSSWQKKALGLAITLLAPVAIKLIEEKLHDFQKHKTASSLEKLI